MQSRVGSRFLRLVQAGTETIDSRYFQLNTAQGPPVYRERVYAYELYHQLRLIWPTDWPYDLNGEVDKRGHVVLGAVVGAQNTIPDLLVHAPGRMAENLAVVEIKSATASVAALKGDVRKLLAFASKADYELAVLLLWGSADDKAVAERVQAALTSDPKESETVTVLWHKTPGEEAMVLDAVG